MAKHEVTVKLTVYTTEGMTPHNVLNRTLEELSRLRDSARGQGDVDITDERAIHSIQLEGSSAT